MVEFGYTGDAIVKFKDGEFIAVHVFSWSRPYGIPYAATSHGEFHLSQLTLP